MAGCCDPSGYRGAFNKKMAARDARKFLDKGLDSTATPMVDVLRAKGLDGATVLEVGAGAGAALVSMLDGGATEAIGVEISPNYEESARALFSQRGHADALKWHTGDFVDMAETLPVADVVFLNRVVCCYPFMDEMVDAAGGRATRFLAVAYPRKRWAARVAVRMLNLWMRLHKNSFRVFVHDPASIIRRVEEAGFRRVDAGRTAVWHWNVWERIAVAG